MALDRDAVALRLRPLLVLRREKPKELAILLAARHVVRGTHFLNQHARPGWQRNCFNPASDGRSHFRGCDSMDKDCVLALAFEHDASLANQFGYVTYASVANHFRLSLRKARLLGFSSFGGYGRGKPAVYIESSMLDSAWEHALRNPPFFIYGSYRHDTLLDQKYRRDLEPARPWWKRLLGRGPKASPQTWAARFT